MSKSYARIYSVVKRIPRGRVATYGQVAALAGLGGHARQVGYALAALPERSDVPWQRVINAKGLVSARSEPGAGSEQRDLLEREGVRFDAGDKVSLARYRWEELSAIRCQLSAREDLRKKRRAERCRVSC